MKQTAIVEYQIATYSGVVSVVCDENDDDECVKQRARHLVKRQAGGSLPIGYESFVIVDRE